MITLCAATQDAEGSCLEFVEVQVSPTLSLSCYCFFPLSLFLSLPFAQTFLKTDIKSETFIFGLMYHHGTGCPVDPCVFLFSCL